MDFQRHRMYLKKSRFLFISISLVLSRSRRPVPSLTNPIGNGNPTSNNLILGNGNHPISQGKKQASLSAQNNFFSFLPTSTTNQNRFNNIPTMSNPLQRTPAMTNFIPTQNGQSPPPPHIINGNDIEQNFPTMNVRHPSFLFLINHKLFLLSRMMHTT